MLGTATKCGLSSMAASNFSSPENIGKQEGWGRKRHSPYCLLFVFKPRRKIFVGSNQTKSLLYLDGPKWVTLQAPNCTGGWGN